jgi:hypothetical protein
MTTDPVRAGRKADVLGSAQLRARDVTLISADGHHLTADAAIGCAVIA